MPQIISNAAGDRNNRVFFSGLGSRVDPGLRENVDDSNVYARLFSIGAPHPDLGHLLRLWTQDDPDEATGSGAAGPDLSRSFRENWEMTVRVGVDEWEFSHEDFTVDNREPYFWTTEDPAAQADMEAAFAAMVGEIGVEIDLRDVAPVAERPDAEVLPFGTALLYDPETDGFVRLRDRSVCAGGWSDRRTGELIVHNRLSELLRFSDPSTDAVEARWKCPPQRFPALRSFGAAYLSCDSPRGRPGAFAELRITSEYSSESRLGYGLRIEGTSDGVVVKHAATGNFDEYTVLREIGGSAVDRAAAGHARLRLDRGGPRQPDRPGVHLADDPSEFEVVRG